MQQKACKNYLLVWIYAVKMGAVNSPNYDEYTRNRQ